MTSILSLRRIRRTMFIVTLSIPAALRAQAVDDAMLFPSRVFGGGVMYAYDSWDQYWEGTRKRTNDNIGSITTRTTTFSVGYGLTRRLTVLGMLPYVSTQATQGPLHGMRGVQDVQVAAKYRLFSTTIAEHGSLTVVAVAAAAAPASNYTPDFLPLSIGLASRRFSSRLTMSVDGGNGVFLTGTAARTWRDNVKLDRDAYYTDGRLYLTNEVAMPGVFDYSVVAGVRKGRLTVPLSFTEQRTLGGGDIRRQDMPFVSNRMDFTRLDGSVSYAVDKPENLMVRLGVGGTLSGRNVGQSTTFTSGVMYMVHF